MTYSKSAIIAKKPESKMSSCPQSAYVSPYRHAKKKSKQKKNDDIQNINEKIKALNQQYVKQELNTAQNIIDKNNGKGYELSPVMREHVSHNNSISHINIHKKNGKALNLSTISHHQSYHAGDRS
jgi:type IV secretory pathway ATPase VirB11/archaellum biosynthesis ATPase